ncbi:hypothetical protein ANTHELSMS3_01388 [Antarctobacter heliothermus]|uniref:Uncharacterized protein n=1 Tax=Antarctobacter heliothermus TaxID=74033 RepID=A0A222E279_9RHOB|nr:hypothetical protein ANTHELSMS3_01388 [Antarctobacter heliothermus]
MSLRWRFFNAIGDTLKQLYKLLNLWRVRF